MFNNCSSLTSLDVANFDTAKVTDMSNMFYGCRKLTRLDISNFDTSHVTDLYGYSSFMDYGRLVNRKTAGGTISVAQKP